MAVGDFERYYSLNPIEAWDRNRWSVVDPAIALAVRQNALFGPLIDWVAQRRIGEKPPVLESD